VAEQRDRPAGQDLPAPYENPWGLLRRDLLAVLASMRLELWQLWRRNRQGDLPRPAVWPQALAGWFWPLLLVLLLCLLVAAGWAVRSLRSSPQSGAPEADGLTSSVSSAVEPLVASPPADVHSTEVSPAVEPPAEQPAPEQPSLDQPLAEDVASEALPRQEASPQPDPLLEAFAAEPGAELLQMARLREADGHLELVLDRSGWLGLPEPERQGLAEQWRLRAESLGSGRLWLLDARGTPLARSARVGSGMILLAPLLPAHAP
jgi:hypothetical protein